MGRDLMLLRGCVALIASIATFTGILWFSGSPVLGGVVIGLCVYAICWLMDRIWP